MIRFWFFALCLLFAERAEVSARTMLLDDRDGMVRSVAYSDTCIDPEHRYTLETIEAADACFRPTSRSAYGYTDAAVWIRLHVKNSTAKAMEYMVVSPYVNLRFIDVLVVYDDGVRERHRLGSLRPQSEHVIAYRAPLFKMDLNPGQEADIYIRHHSNGGVKVGWEFTPLEHFMTADAQAEQVFGFAIGVIFALIVYNLTLFLSLRESAYVYYVFFGLGSSVLLGSMHGFFLIHGFGIDKTVLLTLPTLAMVFNPIMLYMFVITFFDFKKTAPKLYVVLIALTSVLVATLLLTLPQLFGFDPIISRNVQNGFLPFYYLALLFVTLYAVYRRFSGSVFFLLAILMIEIMIIIGIVHFRGMVTFSLPIIYYTAAFVTLEMLFVSLALSNKVGIIDRQRQQAEKILLEQVRFRSIGNAIAELVHQIKVPIAQLGAVSMRLSMMFEKHASTLGKEDAETAGELEKIVHFLDDSVSRMHRHYRQSDVGKPYDVAEAVQAGIGMFDHRLMLRGVQLKTSLQPCRSIGTSMTLQNVMIAVIEDALDILHERRISNPLIRVDVYRERKDIVVAVTDNAGGIRAKNPNDVFTMYYSDKDTKGFGIGLALAKNMVEVQLGGTIRAENAPQGACFVITLPLTGEEATAATDQRDTDGH